MPRTLSVRWLLLLAMATGACALRLAQLDRRPMHHDEANQAVRAGMLQATGAYAYSPDDHHGPILYYLTWPLAWLTSGRDFSGTGVYTYRVVPVLAGTATILLLGLLTEGIGWGAVLCSAALTALSPAMVYYNRFYIQESLLVCFTFGAIAAGWWNVRTRRPGWALLAGVCLGLMYATKETCIIAYAAMLAGIVVVQWHHHDPWPIRTKHMFGGVSMAAAFALVLLCSFFTHPEGPLDSLRAFTGYFHRAGTGAGHAEPWYYYLQTLVYRRAPGRLVWSEGLIVGLALVGAVAAWARRDFGPLDKRLLRFLTVYTFALTAAYALIPYKTPWCLLSFLHGMILLAGFGAVTLLRLARGRAGKAAVGLALAVAAAQLGVQMWRANFRYDADPRNPYAYVQTSRDFLKLVARVGDLAAIDPAGRDLPIAVVTNAHDAWPLPWYLRAYRQVGFWQDAAQVPAAFGPAVVIASGDREEALAPRLEGKYQAEFYELRPGVLLNVHIRQDLWDRFIATRSGPQSK